IDVTSANVVAVVVMSAANYTIADRWVFPRAAVAAIVALAALPSSAAAQPADDTLAAWDAHIARLPRELVPSIASGRPHGRALRHPARGNLRTPWPGAGDEPQRCDVHSRSRRRRSRLPMAMELVLVLPADRQRRPGRRAVGVAEPRRPNRRARVGRANRKPNR